MVNQKRKIQIEYLIFACSYYSLRPLRGKYTVKLSVKKLKSKRKTCANCEVTLCPKVAAKARVIFHTQLESAAV